MKNSTHTFWMIVLGLMLGTILWLIPSCGGKKTQFYTETQTQPASVPQPKPAAYYIGSEIGIFGVTGKVVQFAPSDEYITQENAAGRTVDLYVHIRDTVTGYTKVVKISQETWVNLHEGDIIR